MIEMERVHGKIKETKTEGFSNFRLVSSTENCIKSAYIDIDVKSNRP